MTCNPEWEEIGNNPVEYTLAGLEETRFIHMLKLIGNLQQIVSIAKRRLAIASTILSAKRASIFFF